MSMCGFKHPLPAMIAAVITSIPSAGTRAKMLPKPKSKREPRGKREPKGKAQPRAKPKAKAAGLRTDKHSNSQQHACLQN